MENSERSFYRSHREDLRIDKEKHSGGMMLLITMFMRSVHFGKSENRKT